MTEEDIFYIKKDGLIPPENESLKESSFTKDTFKVSDGDNTIVASYEWNKGNTYHTYVGRFKDGVQKGVLLFDREYATEEQARRAFERQVAFLKKRGYQELKEDYDEEDDDIIEFTYYGGETGYTTEYDLEDILHDDSQKYFWFAHDKKDIKDGQVVMGHTIAKYSVDEIKDNDNLWDIVRAFKQIVAKSKNESLKESKELDRKAFISLVKLGNKPYDGYSILNDGYFVKRIYANSDDDAIKQFRDYVDKNESLKEDYQIFSTSDIDLSDNVDDEGIDLYYKQWGKLQKELAPKERNLYILIVDDYDVPSPHYYSVAKLDKQTKDYLIYDVNGVKVGFTDKGTESPWLWFASEEEANKYIDTMVVENESLKESLTINEVVELPQFIRQVKQLKIDQQEIENLKSLIKNNPTVGEVIKGTGGARKIRIAVDDNSGKSGGARAAYVNVSVNNTSYLIMVFKKKDQENFSGAEKNMLKKIVTTLKKSAKKNR